MREPRSPLAATAMKPRVASAAAAIAATSPGSRQIIQIETTIPASNAIGPPMT